MLLNGSRCNISSPYLQHFTHEFNSIPVPIVRCNPWNISLSNTTILSSGFSSNPSSILLLYGQLPKSLTQPLCHWLYSPKRIKHGSANKLLYFGGSPRSRPQERCCWYCIIIYNATVYCTFCSVRSYLLQNRNLQYCDRNQLLHYLDILLKSRLICVGLEKMCVVRCSFIMEVALRA